MNERGLRRAMTAVVAGLVVSMTGCHQTAATGAAAEPSGDKAAVVAMAGQQQGAGSGGACVFVKPDGAQKFGHVGWGFRITGTNRWVYGAVENPSGKLYTRPGGDIGAWHAEGTYARMLSDMSRDAKYPGKSEHPYSRYRCTGSGSSDVPAARTMIHKVEERGFLVGRDPKTGKLSSWDCLDATYDVLKAYRTQRLTRAAKLSIPNVWVETLWGWSDKTLKPR